MDGPVFELELSDGGSVLVRAEAVGHDDPEGGPSNVGLKEALSFASVTESLRGVATELRKAIKAAEPDVAEVEFGCELAVKNSKVMCLLVDGEGKATFKVRFEWNKQGRPGGG